MIEGLFVGEFDLVSAGQPFRPNAAAHNLFLQTAKIVASKEYAKRDNWHLEEHVIFDGYLTSDLLPGSASSPTTCTVDVWEENEASGSDPKPLIVTVKADLLGVTIVNYDESCEATTGTYCRIKRGYRGKWMFDWLGCPT